MFLSSTSYTNAQGLIKLHSLNVTSLFVAVNLKFCFLNKSQFISLLSFLFSSSCFTSPLFALLLCLLSSLLSLSAGNSILHSAADSVTSAVQKASQALNERGERLGRAEERTADMMNSAEQFAVTAQKVRQYVS